MTWLFWEKVFQYALYAFAKAWNAFAVMGP